MQNFIKIDRQKNHTFFIWKFGAMFPCQTVRSDFTPKSWFAKESILSIAEKFHATNLNCRELQSMYIEVQRVNNTSLIGWL